MKNMIHISDGETVLWEGQPDRKVAVFEAIFNPMLPIALIWLLFDSIFIAEIFHMDNTTAKAGMAAVIALHLMPVWIYIAGVLTARLKARNTKYVVTDRAVYIQQGIFTINTERSPLNEVNHTSTHIGIIDRICGTGDVIAECVHDTHKIENIRDFDRVCSLITKVSQDQYTDAMFPNDMRPGENHGYNTQYRG